MQQDAQEVPIGCDEQRIAISAECAVARGLSGLQRAQMHTVRRQYQHAAGAGGEEVTVHINLETVGKALATFSR